jgi:hypothetical protein
MMTRVNIYLAVLLAILAPNIARARWLKVDTGRFMTMDPFAGNKTDAPSLHKYVYAADNPVNKIDPSGLEWVDVYVWNAWVFTTNSLVPSMGHVMITKYRSHDVYLSQFPHGPGQAAAFYGPNTRLTYDETMHEEGRPPTDIFNIWVPDEGWFHNAVNIEVSKPTWNFWPGYNGFGYESWSEFNQTQCAYAAYKALTYGGVNIDPYGKYVGLGSIWPGDVDSLLRNYQKKETIRDIVPTSQVSENMVDVVSIPITIP